MSHGTCLIDEIFSVLMNRLKSLIGSIEIKTIPLLKFISSSQSAILLRKMLGNKLGIPHLFVLIFLSNV